MEENITTKAKDSKVKGYQLACRMKDEDPKRSWTSITRELGIGQYPYIKDSGKLKPTNFDDISAVCNLMRSKMNVAIAMKHVIAPMFGLIDPDTTRKEDELNFSIGDISDRDLAAEVERRKMFKGEDGVWHISKWETIRQEKVEDIIL